LLAFGGGGEEDFDLAVPEVTPVLIM